MAILKIAKMGHPILRRPTAKVIDPSSPDVHRLIDDMIETMEDAQGAGLAAPQVHVSQSIVVFKVSEGRDQLNDEVVPLTVLINPVVEPLTANFDVDWEGCLSVPGLMGEVPRLCKVRYRAISADNEPIERIAEGFHARVVQHECDHLAGILYPQRMRELSSLIFSDQYRYQTELNLKNE